jgi:hypothetical protein
MPTIPIPGDVDIEYTTKKIHLTGPATYKVVDPKTGATLEDIVLGPGGEYDGKVQDISVKAKVLASSQLSGVHQAAVASRIGPPTIEVAMELPQEIVSSPATRFVLEIADKDTHVHLPAVAYGTQASFKFVQGEAAAASGLAAARAGHLWAGFRVQGIDYKRFARFYEPSDVYFTLSAEQINGRHKAFGRESRASIALLDAASGSPLLSYVSELTSVQWRHVVRERPPFGAGDREGRARSREQLVALIEALVDRAAGEKCDPLTE